MRQRKTLIRKKAFRDAKLYVIATEGEKTEKSYFETLVSSEYYDNRRTHVECVETASGQSAPADVLKRLNEFKKEYKLEPTDELWMVIDRDSWNDKMLSEVQRQCKQKGFELAITNPAFEFWIVLHVLDPDLSSKEAVLAIMENKKEKGTRGRTVCERLLVDELGSYNKSNPDWNKIVPLAKTAIERCKTLTRSNTVDLFSTIGSNIYLLVEKLIGS